VNTSIDDLDEIAADIDPTKLSVSAQPRFLDRQIVVTISAPDDKSFNALAKVIDILKDSFNQEIQRLQQHSSSP
jgi:hypothetical protein